MIAVFVNGEALDLYERFSIRLNRKIIDVNELSAKDAQFSFSVSFPNTARNSRIFGHADIEEATRRFKGELMADVIAEGVNVFSGKLRLTGASARAFSGNLYVPGIKGISEIFFDKTFADMPPLYVPFGDFVDSVNGYNTARETPVIFPYVLYGLLPKTPINSGSKEYSNRNFWDNTVKLGMSDFPPSVNPISIIKHLFESAGLHVSGTALTDKRILSLYQSYKNKPEYVQPWNYGKHAMVQARGVWNGWFNQKNGQPFLEKGIFQGADDTGNVYAINLFDSTNSKVEIVADPGGNAILREVQDARGDMYTNVQIMAPATGFYKISFGASLHVFDWDAQRITDPATGIQHIGGTTQNASNDYTQNIYEIRLSRDRKTGDFGLESPKMNGSYYYDNYPQNEVYDQYNTPKYIPKIGGNGQLNLVDQQQDEKIILGFSFGDNVDYAPPGSTKYKNPLDDGSLLASVLSAKPGAGWGNSTNQNLLAVSAPGHMKYDKVDSTAGGPDPVLGWKDSERYKIELNNSPGWYAHRGRYDGVTGLDNKWYAQGNASAVVWLEAGETLAVSVVASEGRYRQNGMHSTYGLNAMEMVFSLSMEAFRKDAEWLKVDLAGNGTGAMDWTDGKNFDEDRINLIGFMDQEARVDEYILNFCKAFNLSLYATDTNSFRLDIKQTRKDAVMSWLDLENFTKEKENEVIVLPKAYNVGFTVNRDEEGFVRTGEDGGGQYDTGTAEGQVIESKNYFSYTWFKELTRTQLGGSYKISVPIISAADIWDPSVPYSEGLRKRGTGFPYRFWLRDGLLTDGGAYFIFSGRNIKPAKVSTVKNGFEISYKENKGTILKTFFTLLLNTSACYTTLTGRLEAIKYAAMDGVITAKWNGDLYTIAEITGYDPTGRNRTEIKLIK